jgi:hypothetical protein
MRYPKIRTSPNGGEGAGRGEGADRCAGASAGMPRAYGACRSKARRDGPLEYSADALDAKIDRCAPFHDEWAGRAK